MKMWKKVLPAVLCAVLVAGTCPFSVMAEGEVFSGEEMAESSEVFSSGDGEASFESEEAGFGSIESAEEAPLAGEISGESAPLLGASNEMSDNRLRQSYLTGSSTVRSYLVPYEGGYTRVEAFDDGVLVEQYDTGYYQISRRIIPLELPRFGGFYNGSDSFYLVFGQDNREENNSKEVIRVVRYTKNWERTGAASLYGENTVEPFGAGSLRMCEYGGYLYVRSCHVMYTSPDGLNHQSNFTFVVNLSDMTAAAIDFGYASHSFNQFIQVDDEGYLVVLDHGDAYPRSIVLGRNEGRAGESTFSSNYTPVEIMAFEGKIGDNSTGASLGGLDFSSSSYLVCGNSVTRDAGWKNHTSRNVFLATVSRSNYSSSGLRITWLTSYSEGSGVTASTPQMVKFSPDRFLVLWDVMEGSSSTGKISYVFVDGNGNPVSTVYTAEGYLSDCKPVLVGDRVLWYVTDGKVLNFYSVGSDGTLKGQAPPPLISVEENYTVTYGDPAFYIKATGPEGTTLSFSTDDTNVVRVSSNGKVTIRNRGTARVIITVQGGSCSGVTASTTITVNPKDIQGSQLCFNKIGVINMDESDRFLIVTDKGKVLRYMEDYYYGGISCSDSYFGTGLAYLEANVKGWGNYIGTFEETITPISKPKLHSVLRNSQGVTLSWGKVSGAVGYRIFRKQAGGKYKLIATIKEHNTVNWTDTSAAGLSGKLTYRVKAYTKNGKKVLVTAASGAKSVQ